MEKTEEEDSSLEEEVEVGSQAQPLAAELALHDMDFASAPPSLASDTISPVACPIGCILVGRVCQHPNGTPCFMSRSSDEAVLVV